MSDRKAPSLFDMYNAENLRQWQLKTINEQTIVLAEFDTQHIEDDLAWLEVPTYMRVLPKQECMFFVKQA